MGVGDGEWIIAGREKKEGDVLFDWLRERCQKGTEYKREKGCLAVL